MFLANYAKAICREARLSSPMRSRQALSNPYKLRTYLLIFATFMSMPLQNFCQPTNSRSKVKTLIRENA